MAKGMRIIAGASVLLTAIFIGIYHLKPGGLVFSCAITSGTISYHFLMRLFVGGAFNFFLNNRVNYNLKWFRVGKRERILYKHLRVKKWKRILPTYDVNAFDKKQHTWGEILGAMCQSELVHETIIIFSFLPIISSLWFGSTTVFVLTSVLSALFDLIFVIIQRYNRPRVLKILNTEAANTDN